MITIPRNSLITTTTNYNLSYENILNSISNKNNDETFFYADNLFYDTILARLKLGNTCIIQHNVSKSNIIQELVGKYGINFYSTENIQNATKISELKFYEPINFDNGFMIVGDVHGCLNELKAAFAWANGKNIPVVLLGDIISYGPQTLETLEFVYDQVIHNRALYIKGNHEIRLLKYFWNIIDFSDLNKGNKVTANAYNKLSDFSKRKWLFKLESLWNQGQYFINIGNFHMAHGCIPNNYWTNGPTTNNDFMLGPWNNYSWTNSVPKDAIVVVGHNPKSFEKPEIITNDFGGTSIFLDTGAGKGGKLSCVIVTDSKIDHYISF